MLLVASIVVLIFSVFPFTVVFYTPSGIKRDWLVTSFYIVVGITLLLISIKLFAEWLKQCQCKRNSRKAGVG